MYDNAQFAALQREFRPRYNFHACSALALAKESRTRTSGSQLPTHHAPHTPPSISSTPAACSRARRNEPSKLTPLSGSRRTSPDHLSVLPHSRTAALCAHSSTPQPSIWVSAHGRAHASHDGTTAARLEALEQRTRGSGRFGWSARRALRASTQASE